MTRRSVPSVRVAAIVVTAPALLLTCSLSPAFAADSPGLHTFGPTAVGLPELDLSGDPDGGGVDLYLDDGSVDRVTETGLGLFDDNGDGFGRFGSSVAIADLNGDRYTDLVVGAPGSDGTNPGHVDVLMGSSTGYTVAGSTRLTSPAKLGDEFGAAVVISEGTLWIGAPGTDTVAKDGGAVYRYSISSTGRATLASISSEADLGGTVEAGERFGEVLAQADGGVVVGVPKENVGSAVAAGQIVRLRSSGQNAITSEVWNQNSPGVPGAAESGDHFGAAVSRNGFVVGIPDEDISALTDAGAVQTFSSAYQSKVMTPGPYETQAVPGNPGTAESGDRFGASVTVGILECQETFSMAVGVPGEDIGDVADAGMVAVTTVPSIDDNPSCDPRTLAQATGLPGAVEAGDATGATVATSTGNPDNEEDRYDVLLIGVPGEDVGTAGSGRNTGRAILREGFNGATLAYGASTGDRRDLGYGSVFGAPESVD